MKFIDLSSPLDIGSNCMYLELGPFRLIVDAGVHPKITGKETLPDFSKIPASYLDAILLTHAHLEHLGALPVLSRLFPTTPIICSEPTAVLSQRMLQNSVSIMYLQREELHLKEYPLYTRGEIEGVAHRILSTPFRRRRVLEAQGEELAVTLFPAGHIAGASSFLLEYKHRKIFITGDISFHSQFTISGASLPEGGVDTLIMETTRGATARGASREEELERLIMALNDTIAAKGSVLIPVFALGRMQEMLTLFWNAKREGNLPDCPIFCSGLGVDLIDYYDELHRKNQPVLFSRKIAKELKIKPLPEYIDPLHGGVRQQGIYLVSSGMMVEKTPSYAVAASLLDDPRSSVLFVGYCDAETPGGEILALRHGEKYLFTAFDREVELRARVEKFDLSGHADREELLQMARTFSPRKVILTHGEPAARIYFEEKLGAEVPGGTLVPQSGKVYEV